MSFQILRWGPGSVHGNLKKTSEIHSFTHLPIKMLKLQKHDSYEFLNLSQMYDYLKNIFLQN